MLRVVFDIVRNILAFFDGVVYWALVKIYSLIITLAGVNIFDADFNSGLNTRIYTIISIIMFFKLAFSILNYIVDPDKLGDKKDGFGAIIKNTVIMFILLLTVPIIFKYAMNLQQLILKDNTIGRLVTGHTGQIGEDAGEQMATGILRGFIEPSVSDEELKNTYPSQYSKYLSAIGDEENNISGSKGGYQILLDLVSDNDRVNNQDKYLFTYHGIISTIVGGFACYILLLSCIDIAVRAVKLAFLQLIAPIPIVSYIDPKGQGTFKKWVSNCTGTYLSLFIRLAAIYFAIYIITTFIMSGNVTDANGTKLGPVAIVFLILGTLMFAKELPKLVSDITGIKLDGALELNAMKKLASVPLVGGAAATGAALGVRTAGNLAAGTWNATGGQLAGLIGGKISNGYHGSRLENALSRAGARTGGVFDRIDNLSGNRLSRIGADIGANIGGNITSKKIASNDKITNAFKSMKTMALDNIKNGKAGDLSVEYNRRQAELTSLRNLSWETMSDSEKDMFVAEHGTDLYSYLGQKEGEFGKWYNTEAVESYVNNSIENMAGAKTNFGEVSADFKTAYAGYMQAASIAGETVNATYSDIKKQADSLTTTTSALKNKQMAQREAKKK